MNKGDDNDALSTTKRIGEVVEQVQTSSREIMKRIAPIGLQFNAVVRQVAPKLIELGLAIRAAETFAEQFPERAKVVFVEAGYPPCHRLYLSECARITRAYDAGGIEAGVLAAKTVFSEFANDSRRMNDMLQEWGNTPAISRRIHILRQAVEAYRQGLHATCIPTFLAQLEGLFADQTQHQGQMNGSKYKEYVEQIVQRERFFGPTLRAFMGQIVLSSFKHGEPLESVLSRHAILHGADVAYDTAENAVRAMLLFDYCVHAFVTDRNEDP